jgi:hypothetical protein
VASDLLLTAGLRKIDSPTGWQETLRDRLLQRVPLSAPVTSKTQDSEKALGFSDPCLYWYVLAVDPDYREGLIVSDVVETGPTPRLSPFDTGGAAQGHLTWTPDSDSVRDVVASSTFPWTDGSKRFSRDAYSAPPSYWSHPRCEPTVSASPVVIIPGNPKSWTWEARLEKALVKENCSVRKFKLVMRSELFNQFMKWLPMNPGSVPDEKVFELGRWLRSNTIETPDTLADCDKLFSARFGAP